MQITTLLKKITLSALLVVTMSVTSICGQTKNIPTGYYDGANGLSGYTLKTALHGIIKNGHITRSYGDLYDAYEIGDNDPDDGYVWDMYSENPDGTDPYNYTHFQDKCGNYSVEGDCYNREHLFPQGIFNYASPMVSDYHHVIPTDGKVNGYRSSYPFGEVGSASWTSLNGSKKGSCSSAGYSGTVFEPIDEYKGDIARSMLYFATRYEDKVASWSHDMINSTSDQVYADWFISVLLTWHNNDPVSNKEIVRNNTGYDYQGNRNPYIDHPEYVNSVWGGNASASITNIVQTPAEPDVNETVSVTATVADVEGVKSVSLNWGISEGNFANVISMTNTSGDSYASSSAIPGQADGTRVNYRITVVDDLDVSSSSAIKEYYIGTEPVTAILLDEDFETVSDDVDVAIKDWTNYNEIGERKWEGRFYESNLYAQAKSHDSGEANTMWLISPKVNLDGTINEVFSFDINVGHWTHSGLTIYISTNFNGTDVSAAAWTDITSDFTIPTSPTNDYGTFSTAGTLSLNSYSGNIYIAFKYVGDANASETTTYQVDNVLISGIVGETVDETAPELTFEPANESSNVEITDIIKITANEALKTSGGNAIDEAYLKSVIKITENAVDGTPIEYSGLINEENKLITLTPNSNFKSETKYFLTLLANTLEDEAGNEISDAITIEFTTKEEEDIYAPVLESSTLSGDYKTIQFVFNEPIINNLASLSELKDQITLTHNGTEYTALLTDDVVTISSNVLEITVNEALNQAYNKFLVNENSFKDAEGNVLAEKVYSQEFDASGTDTDAPEFQTGYPIITDTSENSFKLSVKINEAGRVYYKAQLATETTPTINDVLAESYLNIDVIDNEYSVVFSQLQANSEYKVYLVSYDNMPNPNISETLSTITVITKEQAVNIDENPKSREICLLGTAEFSVSATGTGPIDYQWFFNDALIESAISNTLTLNNVGEDNAGEYHCKVSNQTSSINSTKATLTIIKNSWAGNDGSEIIKDTLQSLDIITVLSGSPDAGGVWIDLDDSRALLNNLFYPDLSELGTFRFHYITSNTCSTDTAMATVLVEEVVGVSGKVRELVTIVPNPNRGDFSINYNGEIKPEQILIYSIDGKRVSFDSEVIDKAVNIRLNNSKEGVYFVKLSNIQTLKLIVTE